MPDVVNDALALTYYLRQHLSIDETVQYLLAIERLTIEHWRAARDAFLGVGNNRTTKESYCKDIATAFSNYTGDTRFLFADLSLLPGLQKEALELVSYMCSSLHAVKSVSSNIRERNTPVFNHSSAQTTTPISTSLSRGDSPIAQLTSQSVTKNVASSSNTDATFAGVLQTDLKQDSFRQVPPRNRKNTRQQRQTNNKTNWVHGKDNSEPNPQSPQLRFVCLAVRSGPEETEESLKNVIVKCRLSAKELKVETYAKTCLSTTFRVQFRTPLTQVDQWLNEAIWPIRVSSRQWKGNPKAVLSPVADRKYKKNIYIGNLSSEAKTSIIIDNMKKIYNKEIQSGTIDPANIKAVMSMKSWKRQAKLQERDPSREAKVSVCVTLTSMPGKPLSDVGLNLSHYPRGMRSYVRPWRGQVPLADEEDEVEKLTW